MCWSTASEQLSVGRWVVCLLFVWMYLNVMLCFLLGFQGMILVHAQFYCGGDLPYLISQLCLESCLVILE